ncbi:MAG TPA: hypothetical protein VGI12_20655 [Vicinamibacterales bacterium]|jgi:hypothetical protein
MKALSFILCLVVLPVSAVAARAQSLPSGWSSADIGAVGAPGSASGSGGTFTAAGAGADIWNQSDAFRFVYTSLNGDGTIVARVANEQSVASWTKAGVMVRASLDPGSQHGLMLVSPGKGLAFQRRVETNGESTSTPGGSGTAPWFVKLSRTGTTVAASMSPDGANWTLVGTDTIAMTPTILVGLAVSSHVAGTPATATFTSVAVQPAGSSPTTETLVFFRHGEKPASGNGQLTCQGLNRALALPAVLANQFGAAQYLFAPNPETMIPDAAGSFYYVRPIATIEPTAIRLGLPLNTRYSYTDTSGLQAELTSGAYASSTVFIAWEHQYLQAIVQSLINTYGGGVSVPAWVTGDYDSLYVVRITRANGIATAQFTHDYEGLNGVSTACQ